MFDPMDEIAGLPKFGNGVALARLEDHFADLGRSFARPASASSISSARTARAARLRSSRRCCAAAVCGRAGYLSPYS